MDVELVTDIHPSDYEKYANETTTIENNPCKGGCAFCYKSNSGTKKSHYMSLAAFKQILMQCANTHVRIREQVDIF